MRFHVVLALLLTSGAALAQTQWNISVGLDNTLTFTPNSITGAKPGDLVHFLLYVTCIERSRCLIRNRTDSLTAQHVGQSHYHTVEFR